MRATFAFSKPELLIVGALGLNEAVQKIKQRGGKTYETVMREKTMDQKKSRFAKADFKTSSCR